MTNNINKRLTVILIFIALLSLLLQILWQTKNWSLLYQSRQVTLPIQRDRSSSKNQNQKRKRRIKLTHVMNTYTITTSNNNNNTRKVQPFDQWSTIKSIERALEQNNNNNNNKVDEDSNSETEEIEFLLDVDFVCAIFESDLQYLQHLPCRKVILNRSTRTEYTSTSPLANNNEDEEYLRNFIIGHGNNPVVKELPFLQDIIDITISDYYQQQQHNSSSSDDEAAATSTIADDNDDAHDIDDFYIMLTNSDIGITKDFYSNFLLPKLVHTNNNHNTTTTPPPPALALALSINRLTLPMTKQLQDISDQYNSNNNDDTNNDELLDIIDDNLQSNNTGLLSHPGYDCFIIHSSILKKINLGNMFAGYPPWGSLVNLILKIMATSSSTIVSSLSESSSSSSSSQSSSFDYINYKSSPQGTYHLGNDGSKWKNLAKSSSSSSSSSSMSSLQQQQQQQQQEEQQQQKYYYDTIIQNCPLKLFGNHPYTYLNTINCGLLWSMKTNKNNLTTSTNKSASTTTATTNNNSTIIRVPNFVQSGYEEIYLQSKYYNSRSSK